MRLDKLLADMNLGTRKELKQEIRKGAVLVNGTPVKDPGLSVDGTEEILWKGKPVRFTAYEYYLLNKPAGVISASEDPKQTTVLDLLGPDRRRDLFPVGRLDKDTVGLLLISNDGELAHRLLSPKKHVDKTYYARVAGRVTDEDVAAFREGFDVDDSLHSLPARLEILSVTGAPADSSYVTDSAASTASAPAVVSEVKVTIREGKFHQIKRMFSARGMEVLYLKRLSMGPLTLDPDLPEGSFRPLTEGELEALRSSGD
ncbi:MAG: rRNA pseudouridine synthase [Lachnospiraceae bacterium]|nr:rRNA pseudouridine synthase [Lachnospiraceae bacterium]